MDNYSFFAFIKTHIYKTVTLCTEPNTCRFIAKSSSGILHVQSGFYNYLEEHEGLKIHLAMMMIQ
jgi:hypothetical protein